MSSRRSHLAGMLSGLTPRRPYQHPTVRGTKFYGIFDRGHYSDLMPANLITLAHFSVSSAMNSVKSAGVIGIGVPPRSASRAFIFGSVSASLISLFSLSMISVGVFLGAPTPNQPVAS